MLLTLSVLLANDANRTGRGGEEGERGGKFMVGEKRVNLPVAKSGKTVSLLAFSPLTSDGFYTVHFANHKAAIDFEHARRRSGGLKEKGFPREKKPVGIFLTCESFRGAMHDIFQCPDRCTAGIKVADDFAQDKLGIAFAPLFGHAVGLQILSQELQTQG